MEDPRSITRTELKYQTEHFDVDREFSCRVGPCIRQSAHCNSMPDCPDTSDELHLHKGTILILILTGQKMRYDDLTIIVVLRQAV